MQVENASLGKVCTSCGRNNANALKFCLSCGQQFNTDSVQVYGPDMHAPSFCKRCGIDDPYNEIFCIACGDSLAVPVSIKESADSTKVQSESPLRSSITKPPTSAPVTAPARTVGTVPGALLTFLAVCGAACGVGVAYMLHEQHFFEYAANRILWPHSGLVVYVKPSNCEVTVSSLDRSRVLLAKPDRHGSLSFGSLSDGDYRLTLKAPGYETLGQVVKVAADHPTILGYPNPITLPNRSSTEQ
jgi:Double zinc ribbon